MERNTFSVLLNYLEAHPRVGMVAPRLVFQTAKFKITSVFFQEWGTLL